MVCTCILMVEMGIVGCVCPAGGLRVCVASVLEVERRCFSDVRSRFCCMESERYKLTVLFLNTFFRS